MPLLLCIKNSISPSTSLFFSIKLTFASSTRTGNFPDAAIAFSASSPPILVSAVAASRCTDFSSSSKASPSGLMALASPIISSVYAAPTRTDALGSLRAWISGSIALTSPIFTSASTKSRSKIDFDIPNNFRAFRKQFCRDHRCQQ